MGIHTITIRGRLDSTKTRSSSNVHWRHLVMQPHVGQEGKMSFANYEWLQTLMYVLMWRSLTVN